MCSYPDKSVYIDTSATAFLHKYAFEIDSIVLGLKISRAGHFGTTVSAQGLFSMKI